MGWTNSHLHSFSIGKKHYMEILQDDIDFGDNPNVVDSDGIKLNDILKSAKTKMAYEYDFGDGWMHEIILEKILPFDEKAKLPICLAGEMNCPPENCGGVYGYSNFLSIRQNPNHEEYEDVMEWLGEDFDPDYFNVDEKNAWFSLTEEDESDLVE